MHSTIQTVLTTARQVGVMVMLTMQILEQHELKQLVQEPVQQALEVQVHAHLQRVPLLLAATVALTVTLATDQAALQQQDLHALATMEQVSLVQEQVHVRVLQAVRVAQPQRVQVARQHVRVAQLQAVQVVQQLHDLAARLHQGQVQAVVQAHLQEAALVHAQAAAAVLAHAVHAKHSA